MFFLHPRQEVISRNYDVTGSGFSLLPKPKKKAPENEEFRWSITLIKDLLAIFSSIFLSALGYGMLMVMIAIKMNANIQNEVLMSISAATQIGAGVIFSRFLPSMGQKAGMIKSVYVGSIISAICSLLLYQYLGYFVWLLTIFALGTSLFISGVTRNTIMIDLAPSHVRSLVISFGTMLVAVGNSCGPVIISILKTSDTFASFAVASAFYLISMIPLARLKKVDAGMREEKRISIWRYIKNSPKIMFAAFSVSYAMSSSSAFLIIYGLKTGMSQSDASMLLSVLLFGTILYIPIGYICDHLNRRMLMIVFACLSLICVHLLYINQDPKNLYTLLFLMFGCLAGIKLPAIVLINEKYKPTQRLAVNSAFARMSLTGNIVGLLTTGAIMKNLGPQGLWISVTCILWFFLLFCCFNYTKKIIKKEFKAKDLSPFNKRTNDEQLSEL